MAAEDVEELDTSFQELYLSDATTSTPEDKGQAGKHFLTPESRAVQSKAKRAYHLTRSECDVRREELCAQLRETLDHVDDESTSISQTLLLQVLSIGIRDKSRLTRAIKHEYPQSKKKKVLSEDGNRQNFYTCLRLKRVVMANLGSDLPDTIQENSVTAIKTQLGQLEDTINEKWDNLISDTEGSTRTSALAMHCCALIKQYQELSAVLLAQYQAIIIKLESDHELLKSSMNSGQKEQVKTEMKQFEGIVSLGLKDGTPETILESGIFPSVMNKFEQQCPLLRDMLHSLLVTESARRSIHKTPEYKMKCGVNALACLLSVRSQLATNDVNLVFALMCITYGAGKQFVNMLHAVGLTPCWDTLMTFLDQKLNKFPTIISEKFPDSTPVILLMDNINLYRGNKRHHRLFKTMGPKMWNFTGRGAIIPDMTGLDELMASQETATKPQKDISELKAQDLLLESMPEHKKIWDDWQDKCFMELLDKGLNRVPSSDKPMHEMDEDEFNHWLKEQDFESTPLPKFKLKPPETRTLCKRKQVGKTEILILPLSLENNATITGTAEIFEEFGRELGIPCNHDTAYLPFDQTKSKFDIEASRKHFEFMDSVSIHREEMAELEAAIQSDEKQLEENVHNDSDDELEEEGGEDNTGNQPLSTTQKSLKKSRQKQDGKLKKLLNKTVESVWNAVHSEDENSLDALIVKLKEDQDKFCNTRDHLCRTPLHAAVEMKDTT